MDKEHFSEGEIKIQGCMAEDQFSFNHFYEPFFREYLCDYEKSLRLDFKSLQERLVKETWRIPIS